ncbi:MAG TPA: hypothetical protein VGS21_12550 [Acidimicrobiales bacterium]|nr:hypothetical protein [Acidimicrobiales bacterium]
MKPAMPMVHLTTVVGPFHAKVVAARLHSEGVFAELRGSLDGPYPVFSEVAVYVRADQAAAAREIMLADAVDAAFDEIGEAWANDGATMEDRRTRARRAKSQKVAAIGATILLVVILMTYVVVATG